MYQWQVQLDSFVFITDYHGWGKQSHHRCCMQKWQRPYVFTSWSRTEAVSANAIAIASLQIGIWHKSFSRSDFLWTPIPLEPRLTEAHHQNGKRKCSIIIWKWTICGKDSLLTLGKKMSFSQAFFALISYRNLNLLWLSLTTMAILAEIHLISLNLQIS